MHCCLPKRQFSCGRRNVPLLVNAFELIPLLVVGLAVMWALGQLLGRSGLLIGVVPVFVFGLIVAFRSLRNAITETRDALRTRPPCLRGKCNGREYVLVNSTESKALFRCRCGDLYLRDGDHFLQMLPDHSLLPYMVLDTTKTWRTDDRERDQER